jgi:tRNA threonylcarbamoyladenosine biosynthesis protein TsaB
MSGAMSGASGAMVAIETATETVGVAVRAATGVQAALTLTGRRRHVETLTPALEHLLGQLDLVPGDLGVVAVDIGPGLFTGLRVGVAAAKGLAQSLGIGIVGATSLDVLTAGAAAAGCRGLVLACVDARRGEVFAAVHEVADVDVDADVGAGNPGTSGPGVGAPRLAAGLFTPEGLVSALGGLGGAPIHAVGDGALRYADVLQGAPGVDCGAPGLAFPPPAALLDLVRARMEAGEPPVESAAVLPLYMRAADAKSNFARAVRA